MSLESALPDLISDLNDAYQNSKNSALISIPSNDIIKTLAFELANAIYKYLKEAEIDSIGVIIPGQPCSSGATSSPGISKTKSGSQGGKLI